MKPSSRWTLRKPSGGSTATPVNLLAAVRERGQYHVTDTGAQWEVDRSAPPPALLHPLQLRITREAVVGSVAEVSEHVSSWPLATAVGTPADASRALSRLEALPPQPN